MKKISTAGSIIRTCILLTALFFSFNFSDAQCLVNQLEISTGINVTVTSGTRSPMILTPGNPDPKWVIDAADPIYGTITPGTPAPIVTPTAGHANPGGAGFVSISQNWTTTGFQCLNNSTITFDRPFRLCTNGDFTCSLYIVCDNYIQSIQFIDAGTMTTVATVFAQAPTAVAGNYNTGFTVNTTPAALAAGNYLLRVILGNFGTATPPQNPTSMYIAGNLVENSGGMAIVDDWNTNCVNYNCAGCNDDCYWRVEGNNILNGNNIFGTLSNDNVLLRTNNVNRGTFTSGGLFGWNNTTPTAFLHVDCSGNNPDNGSNGSDIRFENLEPGTGNILAIDDNTGYVYNTGIPAGSSAIDWHVVGNTANTTDYIGTNNNIDFRFYTNGLERMRIKNQGQDFDAGFVGIHTTVPTARLHINCNDGNDISNPGIFQNSDVRFEGLESGTGDILAIDASGYVYNTNINIATIGGQSWLLTGNNASPTDYLGTNNVEDLRFNTMGVQRMMINSQGATASGIDDGYVGVNTNNPTARLHIDCKSGNDPNDPNPQLQFSDIRFEDLENGGGDALVIDAQGYVYRSSDVGGGSGIQNNCSQPDMITKVDANGQDLVCSIIFDDGQSVGIGYLPPHNFGYTLPGPGQYGGPNPISGTGTVALDVAGVTRATSFLATSDAKFKTDIKQIEDPFSVINKLNGKNYMWNDYAKNKINADGGHHYGFIAQEVEKVVPEAVIKDAQGYYAVEYNAFIPILTEGMKELHKLYLEEKAKNQALEERVNVLETKLNFIESSASIDTKGTNATSNILHQNTPNPFGNKTEIKYEINVMQESAYIMLYDLNGREIDKYKVDKGEGSIVVHSSKLVPGMYLYSLVVDGQEQETKRMVFSD